MSTGAVLLMPERLSASGKRGSRYHVTCPAGRMATSSFAQKIRYRIRRPQLPLSLLNFLNAAMKMHKCAYFELENRQGAQERCHVQLRGAIDAPPLGGRATFQPKDPRIYLELPALHFPQSRHIPSLEVFFLLKLMDAILDR